MTKQIISCADVSALADEALYRDALAAVSPERRRTAGRFRFPLGRQLSVAVELLLRKALRERGHDLAPDALAFSIGEQGKPRLAALPEIHFNLSHSGTFALCAVSDSEIGCDVEEIRPAQMTLAQRFFARSEYEDILAQPEGAARDIRFMRYWTLKESFIKALGLGLSLPLDDFSIVLEGDQARVVQRADPRRWQLRDFDTLPGYRCAVCWCAGDPPSAPQTVDLRQLVAELTAHV